MIFEIFLVLGGFVLGWLVCSAGRQQAEADNYLQGFDLGRTWHEMVKEPTAVPEVFRKAFRK